MLCAYAMPVALQDAKYFTPNAWSFRNGYYVFVGDTWSVPAADDVAHISYMKMASAALKPYVVGNYINREPLCTEIRPFSKGLPQCKKIVNIPTPCEKKT